MDCTVSVIILTTAWESWVLRTTRVIDPNGSCAAGTYDSGSHSEARSLNLTLPTTPTISRMSGSPEPTEIPGLICFPMGFSPGKVWGESALLKITGDGDFA